METSECSGADRVDSCGCQVCKFRETRDYASTGRKQRNRHLGIGDAEWVFVRGDRNIGLTPEIGREELWYALAETELAAA